MIKYVYCIYIYLIIYKCITLYVSWLSGLCWPEVCAACWSRVCGGHMAGWWVIEPLRLWFAVQGCWWAGIETLGMAW